MWFRRTDINCVQLEQGWDNREVWFLGNILKFIEKKTPPNSESCSVHFCSNNRTVTVLLKGTLPLSVRLSVLPHGVSHQWPFGGFWVLMWVIMLDFRLWKPSWCVPTTVKCETDSGCLQPSDQSGHSSSQWPTVSLYMLPSAQRGLVCPSSAATSHTQRAFSRHLNQWPTSLDETTSTWQQQK